MTRSIMIVPTTIGVGVTSIALGLYHAFEARGLKVHYFRPIHTLSETPGALGHLPGTASQPDITPLAIDYVEQQLSAGRSAELLETIVSQYEILAAHADFVIIQGLIATAGQPYAARLNTQIATALSAPVVLVSTPGQKSIQELSDQIEIAAQPYGGIDSDHVLGTIINKVAAPIDKKGQARIDLDVYESVEEHHRLERATQQCESLYKQLKKLVGCIPWDKQLVAPRVKDIVPFLDAHVVYPGEMAERRVMHITLCARSIVNMIDALKPGTLIITAGDRHDIILATCMAALNGVQLAALLLTGDYPMDPRLKALCQQAIDSGLPILSTETDSFRTALKLQNLNVQVPPDDVARIQLVKETIAHYFDKTWLDSRIKTEHIRRLSPAAFRYQLVEKARQANKRIVLPEGEEPRTIQAAIQCANRNIARCVLLGHVETIEQIAAHQGLTLPECIEIIPPEKIYKNYIADLVAARAHKGMNEPIAKGQLQDPIMLATMMMYKGEVDGLVGGAENTTAHTIRPALQLIKTADHAKIVSSIFFMCLPDQVLVYGDCAVNPNPTSDQLADIAIQSADSASAFGIIPKVAMISYATGGSGSGSDVEKVKAATEKVRALRPDIIIDGPLQYDAAMNPSVAQSKAPDSPVAGQATVFIFPDLNTGNTTYKAVQRSANVLSIGPMLQGLRKPVNDLSRGASVEDIVYTIAITAIQATQHTG